MLNQILFSKLAKDILHKDMINQNRSGKIDEINDAKYCDYKDYGSITFYNDSFIGVFNYNFSAESISSFNITGLNNSSIKSLFNLINKNRCKLQYEDNNLDINYYIKKANKYFDKNELDKSGIGIINIPKLENIIEEKKQSTNPFDSNYEDIKLTNCIPDEIVMIDYLIEKNNGGKRRRDFYSSIHKCSRVVLNNVNVDDDTIKQLKEFFKITDLVFNNCCFSSSNLYLLKDIKISFYNMDITLDYLNNTNANYKFTNCNITNTKFTKIDSKKIEFKDCNIDYHTLSFISSFENILELQLDNNVDMNDIARNFSNVKNLVIEGKVNNFSSITKLSNLDSYIIGEMSDMFDNFYRKLTDEEKKSIFKYKDDIEIKSIINHGKLSDYDLCGIEKRRILSLCKLYNTLKLDTDKANILKSYKSFYDYVLSNDFPNLNDGQYIYDGNFYLNRDSLKENELLKDIDLKTYDVYKNYLVKHSLYKDDIYESFGHLFYFYDGRPIISSEYKHKPINNKKDALAFASKYNKCDDSTEDYISFSSNSIIDYIVNTIPEEEISVPNWLFGMSELIGCSLFDKKVIYNDVMNKLHYYYGDSLQSLYQAIDNYKNSSNKKLKSKYFSKKNEILNVLLNNYDILTKDEVFNIYEKVIKYDSTFTLASLIRLATKKYNIKILNIDYDFASKKCNYDFKTNIDILNKLYSAPNPQEDIMIDYKIINDLKKCKGKRLIK